MATSLATRREPVVTVREMFFPTSPPSDPQQQADLERAFLTSLRLPNKVYKTTYPRRLEDLNELVNALLPRGRLLRIMDTAVSTGVSTWEWVESLQAAGIEHHMTAGDLTVEAYLVALGEGLQALVEKTGYPWRFEVAGKPIPNPPGKRNWLRYFPQLVLLKLALRLGFRALREASRQEGNGPLRKYGLSCRPVPLIDARLRRLPDVEVIEDDILVPDPALRQRFDALRAANILNRCYFDDGILSAILTNLRSRLKRGGLLIACRTDEQGRNNGTVFRLEAEGRFAALARIRNGSEIEPLVLGLPARP